MTSASSPSGTNGLTAAVVARDSVVRCLLVKVLRESRIPFSEWAIEELAGAVPQPDVVCTGPSAAAAVLRLGFPTVIVTRGLSIADAVLGQVSRRRALVISSDELTPVTLLGGLLGARFGIDLSDVPARLSRVPPALLRGFLRSPRAAGTIRGFSRASGLAVDALRAMEKDLGCTRFEALVTRLRAGVYRWLASAGVDRTVVQDYLGIKDRSDFRRACRRAGIPVPWGGNERT